MEPQHAGTSGYMRTDILGYEDLHPTEGYQFLPRDAIRQSPNGGTSTLFPLNKKVNDRVQPVALTESHPTPVQDPVLPSVKKGRSKLIFDTMVSTIGKQIQYGQQKRLYDQTVRVAEGEVERQQIEIANELALRDREAQQRRKMELRETYRTQFQERAEAIKREIAVDEATEQSLREYERAQDRVEAEKIARKREITAEQNEEFRRLNNDVMTRKAERIDREMEEDRMIQKQSAEYQAERDARANEDVRRRMEKTEYRAQVADQQARKHAAQIANSAAGEEQADSESAQAAFDRVNAMKMKYQQMEAERHSDWVTVQKEKEARKKQGKSKPFPSKREGVDADAFDRKQRKIESNRLQDYLRMQMEERKARENQEIADNIAIDNEMIATRQREFDQSLRSLKSLVPDSTGIEVPEYTPSRSITKLY